MESYLIYIGKTAVATGSFYIVFMLLFQNKKQFAFNRVYLPVSLALSFVIPFITFTTYKTVVPATTNTSSFAYLAGAVQAIETPALELQWYHYLFVLYILVGTSFFLHLLFGYFRALNIVKFSRLKKLFGTEVNITPKDVHPFSFFNKIVLSEKTLDSPNLDIIVDHEKIHVQEQHTLDILFSEILFLFQWFNPFAWLIKDAVKNNLEYKTDHQITQKHNTQKYQLAMVALADKEGVAPFLTAMNGSQLKNRIMMMKKKTKNRYAFLKQLAILPLLAILIMGLSNKKVKTEFIQSKSEGYFSVVAEHNKKAFPLVKKESDLVNYQLIPDKSLSGITNNLKKPGTKNAEQDTVPLKFEVLPQFPGGDLALRKYISKSVKYPSIAQENGIEGKVFVTFIIDETGKVVEPHISKGVDPVLDKEALRVVNTLPDWKPAKQRGKNIAAPYTVQVSFSLISDKLQSYSAANPLYIVDGKEVSDIKTVDPGSIKSIDVLKGGSATGLYGEKGKNGVILISTKKEKPFDAGNKLVIVDGKEFDGDINDIPPSDIARIEVIKNQTDKNIYDGKGPEKDKIIIHTKTKYNTTKITTPNELRKFIAKEVKYPEEARIDNVEGVTTTIVEFDSRGNVIKPTEKLNEKYLTLDEIVVIGYKNGDKKPTLKGEEITKLFGSEIKRVINKIPKIDIEEFKGKPVAVVVRFVLQ